MPSIGYLFDDWFEFLGLIFHLSESFNVPKPNFEIKMMIVVLCDKNVLSILIKL